MARFRPEDCAIDRATDRHGIHEVAGPLLAGGVSLIGWRTGLLNEDEVRHALTDERRFRAHLEFRERAFRLAAPVLYGAAKSPVDLFRLIDSDEDQFDMVEHIMIRHIRHDGSSSLLPGSIIRDIEPDKKASWQNCSYISSDQEMLYAQWCDAQRYYACWKLLMKLDFIQGYMYFLKDYEKSRMGTPSSISEYENAALEKINLELSSSLHDHLDDHDCALMNQYYDRAKLRQLARECATQAQTIGVILVGEALPINPHVRTLPLIKRIQGRFRTGAASRRPWQLLAALATLATVTRAGGLRGSGDALCTMV